MRLSKIMKEKKVTTKELADLTGINIRTLEAYRSNRIEPNFKTGLAIAKVLKVDPYDLLDEEQ